VAADRFRETDMRIERQLEPARTILAGCLLMGSVLALTPGCETPPAQRGVGAGQAATGSASVDLRPLRPAADSVQEALESFRARLDAPGATAAFVLRDGRGATVATGVSDQESGRPMQPLDRMLAGSVGKTYVSAIVLQLLEEGRVDLDQKITDWFGQEPWVERLPNGRDITLRMLMNHTSGIPEHLDVPEFMTAFRADLYKVWRPEDLIRFVLDVDPLFPAGKGWSYADTNYILVGMIIERVTGATYYDELQRRLLRPLDLRDTIPSDRPDLPNVVSGYTSESNPFGVPAQIVKNGRCAANPQMEWTGGGVASTSWDLARWARRLYGTSVGPPAGKDLVRPQLHSRGNIALGYCGVQRRLLREATLVAMLDGVPTGRWEGVNYGLGVSTQATPHGPRYGHSGWFPGFVTMMGYYPDPGCGVAVQLNSDIGGSTPILAAFLDEIVGILVDKNIAGRPDGADSALAGPAAGQESWR
jgi:D-alanyl-D-alanine carboxypeptidase